jgi:4-amino-4-deoxy-L-arabinose transferase-like glycosyltransferase
MTIKKYIIGLLVPTCCLYLYNTTIQFYLNDPGIYASLSKRMVETNDFVNLVFESKDWLDKPHFPFWITALSFKIFGISSFAYLLPISIASLLSLIFTFKFTRLFYTENTAWLAVFILATAQYTFMSTTEGRVEPYLMCSIIGSLYYFSNALSSGRLVYYIIGSLFTAAGIMTKGIFILVPIFGSVGLHLLFREKSLKSFFKWQWILTIVLIAVFISPELYSLYIQFDSNPEKVSVNGQHISGIKWFLWDSQFSRFINNGPITRSQGNFLFFLHTLLWVFFPWGILYYISIATAFIRRNLPEFYSIAGGLLTLGLFSASSFQLPHYLTIVFPFFAIQVANYLVTINENRELKIISWLLVLQIILGSLAIFLFILFLKALSAFMLFFILLALYVILFSRKDLKHIQKLFILNGTFSIIFNCILSIYVFPLISDHRADIKAAKYLNEHYKSSSLSVIGYTPSRFNFYCNIPIIKQNDDMLILNKKNGNNENAPLLLYTDNDSILYSEICKNYNLIKSFDHYDNETINPRFLNPSTRNNYLRKYYLFMRKN